MSDISSITTKVRYLIDDSSRTQIPGDVFTYGSSSIFTLSEPNIISVTDVLRNSSSLSTSNYSYNSNTNKVTISSSLTSGDTIEIQYTYYSNFSDNEIESYIRSASIHISLNNYATWEVDSADNFYPDITDAEQNLISVITSILMKPDNVSYRLPDLTINVPKSMPTKDLISEAIRKFKTNTTGIYDMTGSEDNVQLQ
jgi:hypothetical protein